MSRSPLVAFLMAIGLRAVLNVAASDDAAPQARRGSGRGRGRARRTSAGARTATSATTATTATAAAEPAADPRRARLALGLLAVGAILMLVFESPVTRIAGVLALAGFVVAGVFALADPRWLAGAPALGQSTRADASRTRESG
jgi:hypothetical protein